MTAEFAQADSGHAPPHRVADWYELFFDLVFVAVIAIAVHLIEVDPEIGTVLVFALLLFPLWWAWVNLMVTNNLFGERFAAIGVLVVAAMPAPAAMAIAIASGIEQFAWLYAAGAAWVRVMLLVMWLVPRRSAQSTTPSWRPLLYNLATASVWIVSIAIPAPYRYLLWAVAVAGEIALLAWRSGLAHEVYDRASISHALERIGLFVVIVIGEAVYLSVTGLAAHPTLAGGTVGLFGFIVCALLARAFFRWGIRTTERGLEAAQRARSYGALRDVVMYLPFLLILGLTFVAASIGIAVTEAAEPLEFGARVLLASGIALFYATNALIGVRLGRRPSGILLLLVPGVVLPAVACLASGMLPAWGTFALVALALVVLEFVSLALGRGGSGRLEVASSPPQAAD